MLDRNPPEAGETWRQSQDGQDYWILAVAKAAVNQPVGFAIVVYQSLETGEILWRPLTQFLGVMDSQGDTHFYRFERVP